MESRELVPLLRLSPGSARLPVIITAVALMLAPLACGTDPAGLGENQPQPPNSTRPDADDPDPDPDPDPLPPVDAGVKDAGTPDGAPDVTRPETGSLNCNFGGAEAKRATPEVLLVFDRSSAMRKTVAGTTATRWNEMSDGIDDAVKETQTGVLWGLKFFPTTMGCEVADGLDVAMAASNYNPVVNRIRGTQPVLGMEGSPLHQAIKKATNALVARQSAALTTMATAHDNPRIMVLATDGLPSCPGGMPGQVEAENAVKMAAGSGIRSFVLGTASPGTPAHATLNAMAIAGLEPLNGDTKYRPVQTKPQMKQALDEITDRLTNCVVTVPRPGPPWPDFVAMNIDGARVKRDDTQKEGWTWSSGGTKTAAHIYGAACERLRANPASKVTFVYGCQGIAPP